MEKLKTVHVVEGHHDTREDDVKYFIDSNFETLTDEYLLKLKNSSSEEQKGALDSEEAEE